MWNKSQLNANMFSTFKVDIILFSHLNKLTLKLKMYMIIFKTTGFVEI